MRSSARMLMITGLAIGAFNCATARADRALPTVGESRTCMDTAAPQVSLHATDPSYKLHPTKDRHGAAEPLPEHALAIDAKGQGIHHPELTVSFNRLAILYWTTGRHSAAEHLLKRALAINERIYGCDYPGLATSLDNLAGLYQATGRPGAAEPLLERALAIDAKAHGLEHPNVASRLNNLAVLYWATGRQDAAKPLFARALATLKKSLPPGHPVLAAIRENYVNLIVQLGQERGDLQVSDSGRSGLTAARGAAGLVPLGDRRA